MHTNNKLHVNKFLKLLCVEFCVVEFGDVEICVCGIVCCGILCCGIWRVEFCTCGIWFLHDIRHQSADISHQNLLVKLLVFSIMFKLSSQHSKPVSISLKQIFFPKELINRFSNDKIKPMKPMNLYLPNCITFNLWKYCTLSLV